MRPARMRRKVALPEPDLPSMATPSPSLRRKSMRSRTSLPAPAGVLKVLHTASAAMRIGSATGSLPSVEAQALGGNVVEPAPEQAVQQDDIETENGDAKR